MPMPRLWWVWVLTVVCLVFTARHLVVVAVHLVVEVVFPSDVTSPQRLMLFFEFLVGQRAEASGCASDAVKNAHGLDAVTLGVAVTGFNGPR
jgi:hypothetical protein